MENTRLQVGIITKQSNINETIHESVLSVNSSDAHSFFGWTKHFNLKAMLPTEVIKIRNKLQNKFSRINFKYMNYKNFPKLLKI